jgi:hypothetical protein
MRNQHTMTTTETTVTSADRYDELASVIEDLALQHAALTEQLREYSDTASDLLIAAD